MLPSSACSWVVQQQHHGLFLLFNFLFLGFLLCHSPLHYLHRDHLPPTLRWLCLFVCLSLSSSSPASTCPYIRLRPSVYASQACYCLLMCLLCLFACLRAPTVSGVLLLTDVLAYLCPCFRVLTCLSTISLRARRGAVDGFGCTSPRSARASCRKEPSSSTTQDPTRCVSRRRVRVGVRVSVSVSARVRVRVRG